MCANNKYWRGYGGKGILLYCWWECKLEQSLWKTVWKFLKKLKTELLYDPTFPLLCIYPDKTITQNHKAPVFTAVLFTISKMLCMHSQLLSCVWLWDPMDCSRRGSLVHGIFHGKNTRVGCRVFLQGTFLTQQSNLGPLCLLHWQEDSLPYTTWEAKTWKQLKCPSTDNI